MAVGRVAASLPAGGTSRLSLLDATGETAPSAASPQAIRSYGAGGSNRPNGSPRPVQSGDRCPNVHQRPDSPIPLKQGIHEAWYRVAHAARSCPAPLIGG